MTKRREFIKKGVLGTEGYLELQAWEKSGGEWQAFKITAFYE